MGMVTILFETGGRKGFGPINDSRPSLCATTLGGTAPHRADPTLWKLFCPQPLGLTSVRLGRGLVILTGIGSSF